METFLRHSVCIILNELLFYFILTHIQNFINLVHCTEMLSIRLVPNIYKGFDNLGLNLR